MALANVKGIKPSFVGVVCRVSLTCADASALHFAANRMRTLADFEELLLAGPDATREISNRWMVTVGRRPG